MDSPTATTTLERVVPLFSPSEQLALAGFLAGQGTVQPGRGIETPTRHLSTYSGKPRRA
ncbi:MAG: hypothetical protein M3314_13565 [Actinomycetota bacterium]|nr:hypothetical protein [Actinomycetota bacterium]